jgi:hypothetical protein
MWAERLYSAYRLVDKPPWAALYLPHAEFAGLPAVTMMETFATRVVLQLPSTSFAPFSTTA